MSSNNTTPFTADLNCATAPSNAPTDAGVAGAGVLLSFIFTAFISLLLSAIISLHEMRRKSENKTLRKVLMSFSDQQIIQGIGIQSVALAKMHTMVPYHFFLVWMLSCLSTVTHGATLLALVNDFRRDWVLRWIRELLMLVNLALSFASGILVLKSVMSHLAQTLPIACVWSSTEVAADPSQQASAPLSIAGTIAVIAGNLLVFALGTWYLHARRLRRWHAYIQLASLLLLTAVAVGATVKVLLMSQAFGKPPLPLTGASEGDWSFGQLLSLLVLLLPVVSAVEVLRGEINVPSPLVDNSQDAYKLGEVQAYQPNPFWGSRGNLVER